MITAYLYNSCSSCRKSKDILEKSGVPFETRDFFRDRVSRAELTSVLAAANLNPSDVFSTRSRVYRERGLDQQHLTDDDMIDLMVEEPTLIRRPLIVSGDRYVVGHNPPKLAQLIDFERGDA